LAPDGRFWRAAARGFCGIPAHRKNVPAYAAIRRNKLASPALGEGPSGGKRRGMPPDDKKTDNAEERWRTLAADARNQAEAMTDPEARRMMLEIADGYDILAERAKLRQDNGNHN
jgi:hypothetical protein